MSIGLRLQDEGQPLNGISWDAFEGEDLRMTGRLDEEQAAVYTGILDISFAIGCKLLSKVCRMLVFDVFDDGIPAAAISTTLLSIRDRTHHLSLLT